MKHRRQPAATVALALGICIVGAVAAWSTYSPKEKAPPQIVQGDGVKGPAGMMWVPGGEFLMGSDHKLAQPNERPAHHVKVGGFWMDRHHVTNAEFRKFVEATGYVTTAEKKPDWETIKVQVPPGTPKPDDSAFVPGAMVFVGTEAPVPLNDYSQWWRFWSLSIYNEHHFFVANEINLGTKNQGLKDGRRRLAHHLCTGRSAHGSRAARELAAGAEGRLLALRALLLAAGSDHERQVDAARRGESPMTHARLIS